MHAAGGLVYCDGANFNAIVGKVRPGDLGIDAMHINLHKTFSTPHGGGGPGSGPVVLSEALAPFGPLPFVDARPATAAFRLVEEENAGEEHPHAFGRMVAFHGQMGMFTRALAYILSHGADGLKQVAEDAVLNANYVLRALEDVLDAPFAKSGPCMHEAIFSDKGFAGGVSTIDLAKALIDEGFHPMTMYFPLVVHGAMLVEPTETESKASLDQFIMAVRSIAERAKAGDQSLKAAPVHAPRRRLDETLAARKPVLTYRDPRASPGGGVSDGRRFYEAPAAGALRSAPAALRNREPIAEVLGEWLAGARPGARAGERNRRACDLFRRALSGARVAAERRPSRCAAVDCGARRRGRAAQRPAADHGRCRIGDAGRSTAPMRSSASTWSTSARGRRHSA